MTNEYKTFTIYGFFINEYELLYVGLTSRNPTERLREHLWFVDHKYKSHPQQAKLYKNLRIARERDWKIEFRILRQIYTNRTQAEQIERQMIATLHPKHNIAGNGKVPYNFVPKNDKGKRTYKKSN